MLSIENSYTYLPTTFKSFLHHSIEFLIWTTMFLLKAEAQNSQDIRLPAYITTNPNSFINYKAGVERITLSCSAGGTPAPTYKWLKDGVDYTKFPAGSPTGELMLSLPQEADAGVYQCLATNKWGTAMSAQSKLTVAKFNDYPANAPTGNYGAAVGEALMLPCNPPDSYPQATFQWADASCDNNKDDMPQVRTLSSRLQINPLTGNLHFSNVLAFDQLPPGRCYKCGVTNRVMDVTKGGGYATISVNGSGSVGDSPPKPYFQSESPQVGLLGGSVTLSCFFSGNPTPPSPTWSKVGGSLPPKSRYEYLQHNTQLTINKLEKSDGGVYKCESSNTAGSNSLTITLNIESTPVFITQPTNKNASNGDTVSFRCEVAGTPVPDIVWYQDGKSLSTSSLPDKYSLSNGDTVLTIANVCKDCPGGNSDLTVIQCASNNNHGQALSSGYLNVLERTQILVGPDSGPTEGANISLPCQAVSDPSSKVTITWYREDQKIYNDSGKWIVEESGNLTFVGKVPDGRYICEASNGVSTARSSSWMLAPQMQTASAMWWLYVIIGGVVLLLCLVLFICFYIRNNKGQDYKVGEKELLNGNDPEKELRDTGFKEHFRGEKTGSTANLLPEGYTTMTRSTHSTPQTLRKTGGEGINMLSTTGGSVMGSLPPAGSEDGSSLNDYSTNDEVGKWENEGTLHESQVPSSE